MHEIKNEKQTQTTSVMEQNYQLLIKKLGLDPNKLLVDADIEEAAERLATDSRSVKSLRNVQKLSGNSNKCERCL